MIAIDAESKAVFGMVLLPLIYLFGYLLTRNLENVFKNLSLFGFFIGHIFSMAILALANDAQHLHDNVPKCDLSLFLIGMINPFTFNFFNPILDYFVCE